MSHASIGRGGIAVAAIAVFFTTVACGTQTKTVEDVQPGAPAVVQQAPFTSADNAERRGRADFHPAISADTAERNGAMQGAKRGPRAEGQSTVPDARIPD